MRQEGGLGFYLFRFQSLAGASACDGWAWPGCESTLTRVLRRGPLFCRQPFACVQILALAGRDESIHLPASLPTSSDRMLIY